jgi:iron complex outermembrane receptor protein
VTWAPKTSTTLRHALFCPSRFILSFFPYDDGLLYIQAAKGVKSGGFNSNAGISLEAFASLPPDEQMLLQSAQDEQRYDTEENWTYEFGGKFTFWEGRAQLNAAIYFVEWTNQQILTLSTDVDDPELALSASNPILGNVAESESKGLELEANVVPVDWLTLNFGYAYTDPTYKDAVFGTSAGWADCTSIPILDCDENGESTGRVDGNRLQNTSRTTFNAGLEVQSPINERGWSAFLRGDYLYRSGSGYAALRGFSRGSATTCWRKTRRTSVSHRATFSVCRISPW